MPYKIINRQGDKMSLLAIDDFAASFWGVPQKEHEFAKPNEGCYAWCVALDLAIRDVQYYPNTQVSWSRLAKNLVKELSEELVTCYDDVFQTSFEGFENKVKPLLDLFTVLQKEGFYVCFENRGHDDYYYYVNHQ